MERTLYKELINWKNNRKRKPLLLQGARQVGKTYLVDQLGKREYSHYIHLNFEQNPDLATLFRGELDPLKIIDNISLYFGKKVDAVDTLIFFDEIQVVPEVLTSLKYFNERASEYHVIAAGSLLGVSVSSQGSFPVGNVNFITLYPMSFVEYLNAMGEELLLEHLISLRQVEALPDVLHDKLNRYMKMYLFLGGMPEVVQDHINHNDVESVRSIQYDILNAYQRDFSKYTDTNQAIKTSEIWNSIPRHLARENKKFKYSEVRKKARASTFEQTTEWLKKAGLVHMAYNLSVPKLPLAGYADHSKFKMYMHDTGLLGAMLKVTSDLIVDPARIFSEYNGAFIENFVAQELTSYGYRDLFYWTSKSDAEVDFVLQEHNHVYPVEVKSGPSRNIKSLRSYENQYKPQILLRLSPRNFVQSGNFVNLPLYACFLTRAFLKGYK